MKLNDVQKKLAEQLLLSVINRENVVEYNELAARIDPPIFWRQVGREIGEVSKLCHKLGLPLISAKVVAKGSGKAGDGFFHLISSLGINTMGKAEKELFSLELKRIRECIDWYILADYLNLKLDFEPLYNELGHRPTAKINEEEYAEVCIPTTWIFPADNSAYDVIRAFEKLPEIDWWQRVGLKIDDIVYIYCTKPYQQIMFKTVVVKLNIAYADTIDDRDYSNEDFEEENHQRVFARLKLTKAFDSKLLSLPKLIEHGLKMAPKGALRPIESLYSYIETIIEKLPPMYEVSPLPEELDSAKVKMYAEGSKKQITVNAYERSPMARNDCIRIHGSKCIICGFDFASFYGEKFAGKIHVHHIKPINTVNEEYTVDPEHDLAPVCPNCHMVLHLKPDGVYEIDEVRQMIVNHRRKYGNTD